jgi:HEAT repeat protein
MEELRKDPAYRERERWKDKQEATARDAYRRDAKDLLAELNTGGFAVESIRDLRTSGKTYEAAIPILLTWLPRVTNPHVKEDLVRTLSVPFARTALPFLLTAFDESEDASDALRWAIANGIEVLADNSTLEWLLYRVHNRVLGRSRQMLVMALGKLNDPRSVTALVQLLRDDAVCGHALKTLNRLRAKVPPAAVESLLNHPQAWVRSEAAKLLGRKERRGKARKGRTA